MKELPLTSEVIKPTYGCSTWQGKSRLQTPIFY